MNESIKSIKSECLNWCHMILCLNCNFENQISKIWWIFNLESLDDIMLAIKSELMNDWLLIVKKKNFKCMKKIHEMLTNIAVIMQNDVYSGHSKDDYCVSVRPFLSFW